MAVKKSEFNIVNLVNNDGCFDLQFRKDIRRERTNSPTYYRWKIQFIITAPKKSVKILEKTKRIIQCGNINIIKNQARFSVQNISEISKIIVPYFQKNRLSEKKKKDFELWKKAVNIVHHNKGISLSKWERNDLVQLMEIHKSSVKYKNKPRKQKWIEMAKALTFKKTP